MRPSVPAPPACDRCRHLGQPGGATGRQHPLHCRRRCVLHPPWGAPSHRSQVTTRSSTTTARIWPASATRRRGAVCDTHAKSPFTRHAGDPNNGDAVFWFSMDYGRVHFTFMSTEHPYAPGSPQYEFLQQDLAAANANRANVPWIVLTGWADDKLTGLLTCCSHRPMYSSDADEESEHWPGAYFQTVIEPLMHEFAGSIAASFFAAHLPRLGTLWTSISAATCTCTRCGGACAGASLTPSAAYQPGAERHDVSERHQRVHESGRASARGAGHCRCVPGLQVRAAAARVERCPLRPSRCAALLHALAAHAAPGYGRMHVFNASHIYFEQMDLETNAAEDTFWLINTEH